MPNDFIARPPYNVLQPGAYSAVNASLLTSANLGVGAPIPAIIGTCLGGVPDQPMYFSSPTQLLAVVRSGAAYDCARFAFQSGAQQVCVVRVGNSVTQSTLALAATTGTAVTLTSLDYGSWTTGITISVATGPIITLTYTDVLGNIFTETWNLTNIVSLTPAIIAAAINGTYAGFTASNYVTAVAGAGTLPVTVVSNIPLAGGTDGLTPLSGDWTNGFTVLQTEPVDLIVPATSAATVHAQALAHCQLMSAPNARMERIQVVGGALGESVVYQTATRIPALQSARSQLVYPGTWDYTSAGVYTLFDPFYSAAKVAGMHASLPDVATSLVHAQVSGIDVEVTLATVQGGAVDQLLAAGVSPITRARGGGIWLVDSLTGYALADQTFRDVHKTRSADYVAQYARAQLEAQFVGGKTLSGTQSAITAAATLVCADLLSQQIIRSYLTPVVAPGPNINAYNVGLPVMLIDADKYIFITVNLQPSSIVTVIG